MTSKIRFDNKELIEHISACRKFQLGVIIYLTEKTFLRNIGIQDSFFLEGDAEDIKRYLEDSTFFIIERTEILNYGYYLQKTVVKFRISDTGKEYLLYKTLYKTL